jgi:hypothetical protein
MPQLQYENNIFLQLLTFSVYIHESWTLGKPYGINLSAIENALGNNLRTWGTSGEHDDKMLETHWDQGTKTKNNSPPHSQKEKTVHAEPSHRLHEISISKTLCHHFWPGLMGGPELGDIVQFLLIQIKTRGVNCLLTFN